MTQRLIARNSLGTLTKLGQGGQGVVYQAPKAKARFADSMVFKEYKPQARADVNFEALATMPTLVERTLSYREGEGLISIASWPCALVENDFGPVGFVMPAIPNAFFIDLTTVKGIARTTAEFQHLLNPPSVLAARGIGLTGVQRCQLLHEAARALSFLHRIGVCVGDMSPKNLLFSLEPHPAVYFIDADGMRVNGVSALPQVETPGWEVPTGEHLATIYSDTYKLGLLALRLFSGDQDTKNPQHLPPATPKPLRQLITDTLTNTPDRRPLPEAWTYLLGRVIDEAQFDAIAASTPTPPKPTSPTHSPEPEPVVRTRASASSHGGQPSPPHAAATAVPAAAIAAPPSHWPRTGIAILVAALLGVVVLVVVLVAKQYAHPSQDVATFNGTFKATYGPVTDFNGSNPSAPDDPSEFLAWVVRSSCNGDKCVATATTKNRPGGEVSATFDYVDGRWVAVYTVNAAQCGGVEQWSVFSLTAYTGGSLAGEFYYAHSDGAECGFMRSVTFTRIGDPDPSVQTPDPARIEARKVSPAQALQGSYHYTQTYPDAGPVFEHDYHAMTFCLRRGERCLTYFYSSGDERETYVFAGDEWVRTREPYDGTCGNGSLAKQEMSITVPLPSPEQNPIRMLNGSGVSTTLTECPGSLNFEITITRTGD